MYDDILLPTDGSDGITQAAKHAEALAERFDATIHVLSVVDTRNRFESPTSGLSAEAWKEAERERAEHAVETTLAALSQSLPVETAVVDGVPKTAILDYVESEGMDMVVMGTHGRTGLDHYLIGSVAEKVVRRSPVPVVTVRLTGE
ncbi:universal stress protein [Haloarcula sp. S1CR25-12]|uniref:Universal stress protein n=1 Tax=Haloarcula saliterrae TaxID=2950534 RepID=A0ABU2FET1_9EURY|nr:universal stress protein [Haloarcula sp. S1CR25-12]MDS0260773.1 universal stress protein [Haloarcula sp. S1CR25-12]